LNPSGSFNAFVLLALVIPSLCHGAAPTGAAPATATLVPALGWDIKRQGAFPVSLASDAEGNIWVGTEGNGVWKYDAGKKEWSQFTTKDGLGDDCVYALAVDNRDRVWAGHLNHGVSVYNGRAWRNYGLIDGPLGDRVFAIAVSPRDGDVWIASDMGLARYSEQRQDWDYFTRTSGLPSDQVSCMTFDGKGRLFVGTQCNGIAVADPDDTPPAWHVWKMETAPAPAPIGTFSGLVSDEINELQTIQQPGFQSNVFSVIAALTPSGASITHAGMHRPLAALLGDLWTFIHGQDWREHTAGAPVDGPPTRIPLPAEDWMTALRIQGLHGWIGFRKSGVESRGLVNVAALELRANVPQPGVAMIRSMLILPDGPPLFAAYDAASGGLLTLDNAPPLKPVASGSAAAVPELPAPVQAPALDDAKALTAHLGKLTRQVAPGEAFYLADDWRTEGDWVGRYGGGYAKLCGMGEHGDEDFALQPGYAVSVTVGQRQETALLNAGGLSFAASITVGQSQEAAQSGAAAIHDDETSDDLRSLYDPTSGHRRDAADSDGGAAAAGGTASGDGPGLWVNVKVPDGVHCLSLYFVNNDAHAKAGNEYRDYDVQVFSDENNDGKVQTGAPLVRTRVTDFWGGVYKQFLICGPANYGVRIGRNRSEATRLQGVFLDPAAAVENPGQLPGFVAAPYGPPDEPDESNLSPLADAASTLWDKLGDALPLRGAVAMQMPFRIWCYRAAIAGQAPPEILERWRWQVGIWNADDRKKYDDAMKAAHDALR